MADRYVLTRLFCCRCLARFRSEERGSVAIIFGLMSVTLFAMIGVAVDYARFVNARNQTIAATDAAVLAATRALQTNGNDQGAAIAVAKVYYAQAIQNRIGVLDDTIDFAVSDNATAVVSTGNAYVLTPFMGLVNTPRLQLLRTSGADYSKAILGVGGNSKTNLEISLMLDITGSMAGQKLIDMQAAATDLVNIVVWSDQSQYTSRVAIVPFAYDVRLPAAAFKLATGSSATTTPCVVERIGTQKYTDAAPAAGQYVLVHNDSKTKKGVTTYTPTCDLTSTAEAMPLTSDKSALTNKIANLVTAGSTAGHLGTAWAWYMLSPNWASLWSSSSTPAGYSSPALKKIAVLMTDGEYNTEYKSNGVADGSSSLTYCPNAANGCSSVQAVAQCTAMKAAGIEVYTVGFQLDNQLAVDTLTSCATDASHFYNSTSGDALKQAFRDIALKISSIYLSQ